MPSRTTCGRLWRRLRRQQHAGGIGTALDHAARHELAESIYDESERLNRLVANLLDMTRLEGGAMSIKKDWHSLEEIVGVVLNRLRQLAGHRVDTHLDPTLPLIRRSTIC